MNWIESISKAIDYIEKNITNDITIDDIAKYVCISPFYLQKGFSILCDYSLGEYIRNRKLSLAGQDLINTKENVIDIALKYGYESADSFTKAFKRFHGTNPSSIRKGGKTIKEFSPLKVNLILKGGYTMEYKIEEKEAFKVIGLSKIMKYDSAYEEVPKLWKSFFAKSQLSNICTKYGVNIDSTMSGNEFEYMICDDYLEGKEIPKDFIVKEIPKHTWAIFSCIGRADKSVAEMNEKIFKEWLPNSTEYEIADGYNVEMYSDPANYKKGTEDDRYYCEIWIPVRKK
ncbi:MAG: AraC family transcriptional regulator [Clostridia bacterium]|nr:AraC family transcriptional regulator [Clostridia bacterium]